MSKRVVHHFTCDFDKVKEGQFILTQCGQVFMAGPPPTPEENAQIADKTKNDPECKRCLAKLKGRKSKS